MQPHLVALCRHPTALNSFAEAAVNDYRGDYVIAYTAVHAAQLPEMYLLLMDELDLLWTQTDSF